MPGGLRFIGRRFRPGLASGIAVTVFIALTVSLGNWQTRRAEEKIDAARKLAQAMRNAVLSVPSAPVDSAGFERRRVSVRGHFVARSTLFLDNQVLRGIAGYRVLTPLSIEGGDMHIFVDRGVATAEDLRIVEGIAMLPSRRFVELGPDSSSGPLRQNLVLEREGKRLALKLQPFVIEQTSEAPDGLTRAWERPDAGVERNRGYALQWYAFALLAVILYVAVGFKRVDSSEG